jgi:hypothetical protein
MIEYERIHDFLNNYILVKNTIDSAINEKLFILKGFKSKIYNFTEEQQFVSVNNIIINDTYRYMCASVNDVTEVDSVKYFKSLYIIVNLYDKFWIISMDNKKCRVILIIHLKDYVEYMFNNKINTDSLAKEHYAPCDEYVAAYRQIIEGKDCVLAKQILHDLTTKAIHYHYKYNSSLKTIHYFYKKNNIIYIIIVHNDLKMNHYCRPVIYADLC